jgi:dolichyl-phosphate beta-glucosyltransferase
MIAIRTVALRSLVAFTVGGYMDLSLLLPAYNERARLPPYLRSISEYLARSGLTYEVVIVDDGSTEDMQGALKPFLGEWPELRMVCHPTNQGRGEAIRTGCATAHGDLILFADADGATPIAEEAKLRAAIKQGADVAIGSRIVAHAGVSRFRAFHRAIISKTFASLGRLFVSVPVRDSQCGFKMWRRQVGQDVLPRCCEHHWLMDLEFLAVADCLGYRIVEVPVNWSEIPGSKVRLLRDSWQMFRGLWKMRRSIERMRSDQDGLRQISVGPS